ncbi:MAG TPA: hypothetical protein VFX16_24150 [Pseudonocardiaceae bacterium]|nr:hypothetical protein [Pseudonocardiaceae bacterium]
MCVPCAAEYHDPANRRFHAQPTCCPTRGPQMNMPIADAAALLRTGDVLAIKGLGGYHLAVLAANEQAASTLRQRNTERTGHSQ